MVIVLWPALREGRTGRGLSSPDGGLIVAITLQSGRLQLLSYEDGMIVQKMIVIV